MIFIFRSITHFELIFVCETRYGFEFTSLCVGIQLLILFAEKTLNFLSNFFKC